jgi:hypothetical protein
MHLGAMLKRAGGVPAELAGWDRLAQLRSGELGHAPSEVDLGAEAKAVGGQGLGGEHVADVAGTPASHDLGGGTAHGFGECGRQLADGVALATSVTWTKSRRCRPSSCTVGARPPARALRKMDATPA